MSRERRAKGMGTVTLRADGRYQGRIELEPGPDGKRQRKTVYARTEPEAWKKLKALVAKQEKKEVIRTDERGTLAQYLTQWLRTLKATGEVRPATYVQYEVSVRCHIVPRIGRIRLTELTTTDVKGMVAGMIEAGKSPSTAQLARATLRTALSTALDERLIQYNPAMYRTKKGTASTKGPFRGKYLDEGQAHTLLDVLHGHRWEALYLLTMCLALRKGEALALRWQDCDLERATVVFTGTLWRGPKGTGIQRLPAPKTAESYRKITLPLPLHAALLAHHEAQQFATRNPKWRGNQWNLVFTSEIGTPIEPSNVNRTLLHDLLPKAGIDPIRVHDLRHTGATLMLAMGIELRVVQAILGHTKISTTSDIYGHVLPRQTQDVADRMGLFYFGPSTTGTAGTEE